MLQNYQKKFCVINKKKWGKNTKNTEEYFLVEGLLGAMPTHLVRLGVTANAVKSITNMAPVTILKNHNDELEELFRSFGMSKFVYLDDINLNLGEQICVVVRIIPHIIFRDINYLLKSSYKGINFGHLVFDDILHSNKTCYTIEKTDMSCVLSLYRCICYIKKYSKIISKYNTEIVLLTHNEYVDYGSLAIAAILKNKTIVNINDYELAINKNVKGIYFHNRIHIGVEKIIFNNSMEKLEEKGKKILDARTRGEVGLYDAKNAFGDKKVYTRVELSEQFSHNTKKNVFIFLHVFSDAPHLSQMTMYRDYYEWTIDTIDKIRNIDNVNWYIKAHPSAFIYGETDKMREMMKESKGNIFWVPDDFSALSIKNAADAIITCQGTVGIEASCMGIPVVITGLPYYARFGFTIEPKTRKEYHSLLNKLHKIRKLPIEKIKKAQAVLGAYSEYTFADNTILDSEVYEYAGYGKQTDYRRAYDRIIQNMQDKTCNDIPLYNQAEELMRQYLKQK